MTDREQTRQFFTEIRASLKNGQDALNDLQRRHDALLAELEQAERERDLILTEPCAECGHIDWRADVGSILAPLEARLAAVPALVEKGKEYRKWRDIADAYPGHEAHDEAEFTEIQAQLDVAQEAFDEALAVYEQAQEKP